MAKWIINANHSTVQFAVRHMMVSWVPGQFNRITGVLHFAPEDVAASALDAEIDAAGIYTGVTDRDNHLKGPDFLDVEKYPAITFKSTRVEPDGLDRAWVHGNLTLRGVTRPVTLDVRWTGPAHFDDEGKIYTSFGFQAATRINREDFGMMFNMEMEHGGFMLGKQVHLTLHAEMDLAEE